VSLIERKPRPLTRDAASLRDDRLFIVACDDTYAPKQYFDFFRLTRVQIHVVPTEDGASAAGHVLRRLLEFEHEQDDELWILLDTDHYTEGHHLPSVVAALAEARRQGVRVALSKPCFEIWLLLHHVEESNVCSLPAARDVDRALRAALGEYNKTNLRPEHYPLPSVLDACMRAARLDSNVAGGDIPAANTSRVYRLWQSIAASASPLQLPIELRRLP
jgi:hypothetical protein